LEIDQEADAAFGCPQEIQALRHVLVGEALHALQFQYEDIFHQEIGDVFAYKMTLIADGARCLGCRSYASEAEFLEQGALIDFFQEAGAKDI
jgi:hypothetical protein